MSKKKKNPAKVYARRLLRRLAKSDQRFWLTMGVGLLVIIIGVVVYIKKYAPTKESLSVAEYYGTGTDDEAIVFLNGKKMDPAKNATYGNGIYTGGLSTFRRASRYGWNIGASANGRRKADPTLADSIGATPGFDTHGPTAALCSALKYDHKLVMSGFVMQLKFEKKMFQTVPPTPVQWSRRPRSLASEGVRRKPLGGLMTWSK